MDRVYEPDQWGNERRPLRRLNSGTGAHPFRRLGDMPAARTATAAGGPGLQFTWLGNTDGSPLYPGDVLVWQPGPADTRRSPTDERRLAKLGINPYMTRSATIDGPSGPVVVRGQRLDFTGLYNLARRGDLAEISASARWFAHLYEAAAAAARAGRVLPTLGPLNDTHDLARWVAVSTDSDPFVAEMALRMPAVIIGGGGQAALVTRHLFDAFVDRSSRDLLLQSGWHMPLTEARNSTVRLLRNFTHGLTEYDPRVRRVRGADDARAALIDHLADFGRRAAGVPKVRWRLRLGLPDLAAEPGEEAWPVQLELVDCDDDQRWCTGEEVRAADEAAIELAGREIHLGVLGQSLDELHALVAEALGDATWGLADPISTEQAVGLLERSAALDTAGVEFVAPAALTRRPINTSGVAEPSVNPRLGAAALVEWSATIDDQPIDELALARAAAGLTLIRVGDAWVRISAAQARRALANLEELRAESSELSAIETLRLAAELETAADDTAHAAATDDQEGTTTVRATGWLAELIAGLPDQRLDDGKVPDGFVATLRPYQQRGLGWMQFLRGLGLGGCLADDMGLGKTPTTLAHLAGEPGPHLVVCPLSVVRNWQTEAARFTPLARVMVHHGSGRANAEAFVARVAAHDIVLTTYAVASRDVETLRSVPWSTLVLDEAQAIKNPLTATAKAVRRIGAQQVIALTGTPVENRLAELWSIMHTANPGLLGTQADFRSRFALPIERHHNHAAAAALRQITAPFLLRRTKADKSLVPDLPDKVEQLAWATLTKEQANLYQQVVEQLLADAEQETGMRRRGLVLAALTKLKQICNHPAHALGDGSRLAGRSGKLARFDELIEDLLDADERALVFTQYRAMGELLQQHLTEKFSISAPFLHGGVSKTGRQRMVDGFQDGTAASPLLIVSLKAGGTGLNLTAASRVVHYDRWWNPAVEDQATDRAWRIGQQRAVFVHKLVCTGTVEERVDALINDKRVLASSVIGSTGEHWLSELSTSELRDLVVLDPSAVQR